MNKTMVAALMAAVFGAGYIVNDLSADFKRSQAQKESSRLAQAKSNEFRTQFIEKLIQAKGAATGGINLQGWTELTKSVSVSFDTFKIMGSPTPAEIQMADSVVSAMASTSTAWRDLSACDYNPTETKCLEKIANTLYFADSFVVNDLWNKDDPSSKFILSLKGGASKDEFKRALRTNLLEVKEMGERFSVVGNMLSVFSTKADAYFTAVKEGSF